MLFLELPLTRCVPADKSLSCSVPHLPHPEIAAFPAASTFHLWRVLETRERLHKVAVIFLFCKGETEAQRGIDLPRHWQFRPGLMFPHTSPFARPAPPRVAPCVLIVGLRLGFTAEFHVFLPVSLLCASLWLLQYPSRHSLNS